MKILVKDTSDNKVYTYNGTSWVDTSLLQANFLPADGSFESNWDTHGVEHDTIAEGDLIKLKTENSISQIQILAKSSPLTLGVVNIAENGGITYETNSLRAGDPPEKAFDGTSAHWNTDAGPGWVGIEFATARIVGKYDFDQYNKDVDDFHADTWYFEGTNDVNADWDAKAWDILDDHSVDDGTQHVVNWSKVISNTTAYKFYRMRITSARGILSELRMYEMT